MALEVQERNDENGPFVLYAPSLKRIILFHIETREEALSIAHDLASAVQKMLVRKEITEDGLTLLERIGCRLYVMFLRGELDFETAEAALDFLSKTSGDKIVLGIPAQHLGFESRRHE
jgi:hypothetical protein